MPITKSAKKAYLSSERKRAHNLVWGKKLKIALKKVNKDNVNDTVSVIDKTAKRHLISKNKAARLKSRLAKKFGTPKQVKTPAFAKATAGKQSSKLKASAKKTKDTSPKKPAPKPKTSSKK